MFKKLLIFCALFLLLIVIIVSPQYIQIFKGVQAKETPSDKAFEIMSADSRTIILDLQSELDYSNHRVTGAINVAPENLEDYAAENLKDKRQTIICYCFCGGGESTARSAYTLLTELGYKKIYYTTPGAEWSFDGADESSHRIVSGEEAKEIYDNNSGTILLDVRNKDEYEENHIEGSVLIPAAELKDRLEEIPDKNTNIIVFCKAGVRSNTAYKVLQEAGYINLYDMQAIDNWIAR